MGVPASATAVAVVLGRSRTVRGAAPTSERVEYHTAALGRVVAIAGPSVVRWVVGGGAVTVTGRRREVTDTS